MSDGATESAFAREWADILVTSAWHQKLRPAAGALAASELPQKRVCFWLEGVRDTLAAHTGGLSLPWYGRAKAREGAAATFLGVRIMRFRGRRSWVAVACGDTCLFHLGAETGPVVFPLNEIAAFGNRPLLVPSNAAYRSPGFRVMRGTWEPGDRFILTTDALAVWLLGDCKHHERLPALLGCRDAGQFAALVEQERAAGRLKNDDTTALIYRP